MAIALITSTIASKLNLVYLTETILSGWLGNASDRIISEQIPNLSKRVLTQLKNTEKPENAHLQKAILSAHWLATKVFAEEFIQQNSSPLFQSIVHVSENQINNLKKNDYQIKTQSPDFDEIETIILNDNSDNLLKTLKNKVTDYHLEELKKLLVNINTTTNPDYINFQNAIKNGITTNNNTILTWFELACSFFGEFLKGDNNKVKDAFQNQELVKIYSGIDDLKESLAIGFASLTQQYIQNIGQERYTSFVKSIEELSVSLNILEKNINETKEIANETYKEVKKIAKNQINLYSFPDYQTLVNDLSELKKDFAEKQAEEQEILDLLAENAEPRIITRFEKDKLRISQDLIKIDGLRTEKENEINEFKKNIEQIWLRLYSENTPETDSPRLAKAKELLEKGDLRGANASLDIESLENDFDLVQKADNYVKQTQGKLAQEFITKANFSLIEKNNKDWFKDVKNYYMKAITLHLSYENCFEFAYFLQNHNQILEAILWYNKTLSLVKDDYYKAQVLCNLGNLQMDNSEYEESDKSFKKAFHIYTQLIIDNPTYLYDMAGLLNNLGNLQINTDKYDEAKKSFDKSLFIYTGLAIFNSEIYMPDLADTLNNIGNLQFKIGKYDDAEKNYEKALSIYKLLVKDKSHTYLHNLAATLSNLGDLQRRKNEYERAENSLKEALSIRRDLSKNNPQTYLPDLAKSLNNFGIFQFDKTKFNESEESYEEALSIYRSLTSVYPQAYLYDVAITLSNLGNSQRIKTEYDKATKSYQEALSIIRDLASKNVQIYLSDVAIILNSWGNLQIEKNEYVEAEKSLSEALSINRTLAIDNPQIYLFHVAMTLSKLGNLQRSKMEYEKAEKSHEEVVSIRRDLARDNPQFYTSDLSSALDNLGITYINKKEYDKALKNLDEALFIRKELSIINPQVYLPNVAGTLNNLGSLYIHRIEYNEAEQCFEKVLSIYEDLGNNNLQNYLPEKAGALNNLGILQSYKKEYNNAVISFHKALSIREELAKKTPEVYQVLVAEIQMNLATFYLNAIPDKETSLHFSFLSFVNAVPYIQQVQFALGLCDRADLIWKSWGENLQQYMSKQ